jgi:hypothetical protein
MPPLLPRNVSRVESRNGLYGNRIGSDGSCLDRFGRGGGWSMQSFRTCARILE